MPSLDQGQNRRVAKRFPEEAGFVLGNLRDLLREGRVAPARNPPCPPGVWTYAAWHRVQGFLPQVVPAGAEGGQARIHHPASALIDLARVLGAMDGAGIPAVPLKGPMLGARLWENPALRVSRDMDLLIPPGRLEDAVTVLAPLTSRLPVNDEYHHLGFQLSSGRVLELHTQPLGPRTGWRPTEEDIWGGLRSRTDAGITYMAFPPHVEVVLVTVHAAHHLGYRLHWMLDVGRMLSLHGTETWSRALDLATRWRVGRAFLTGALAAGTLFDVALPPPLQGAERGGKAAHSVAEWMVARLQVGAASIPTHWERWPRWLGMLEDTRAQVQVLATLGFRPTGADRVATGLPATADALTGLLRPLLLVRRVLGGGSPGQRARVGTED